MRFSVDKSRLIAVELRVFLYETTLDRRIVGALNRVGIETVFDLMALSDRELYMVPGIGKLSLEAIHKLKGL